MGKPITIIGVVAEIEIEKIDLQICKVNKSENGISETEKMNHKERKQEYSNEEDGDNSNEC